MAKIGRPIKFVIRLPPSVNLLSKVAPFSCPIMTPPLRDGRTVGEEPQPDQPAGRTIPILSMLIIPGCLSIATR